MAKDKKKPSSSGTPITDSRFASVYNDPRFKTPNQKNLKVKVDDRFSKDELEKLNAGSSGKRATVDRYGRKINEKGNDYIDKFYEHESDEEEEGDESGSGSGSEEESGSESGSEEESSDKEIVKKKSPVSKKGQSKSLNADLARGEGVVSSDSDSDSDPDSDSEAEVESESDVEVDDTKPEEGDPSSAFAVVNMDWDNLRAVDLMATFSSFVPKNGSIKSITIYPSEFGKEQMRKEEVEGPPRELFKNKKNKKNDDDDDSDSDLDSDIDTNDSEALKRAAKKLYEEEEETDYDSKALRRYQLQRLRYYYAVVKCDSVSTAKNIYDNCDGTEYESTANVFDLRYVPEGMEFDDNEAKEVCNKVSSNYKPNSLFVTDALHHSKVKLTWDETPKERLSMATKLFSQKEIDDMDFKAYLASDSEEEDNKESTTAKDKYKNLLLGNSTGGQKGDDDDSDGDDVDMEITFTPGLDDQQKEQQAQAKADEEGQDEDTISAYKRKQKERRKARMEKFKKDKHKDDQIPDDDQGSEDNRTKNKKKSTNEDKDAKSKAELELLTMDGDDNEDNHFNMKDIIRAEKKNKKKSKSKQQNEPQDDFQIDVNDPRFQDIFEDHQYAIDPTSTDFKQTKNMKRVLDERSKRQGKPLKNKKQKVSQPVNKSDTNDVNSLVAKLKRKHGK